jgi:hypothetical protein
VAQISKLGAGNAEASPSDKQQQQQQPNGEPSEQAQAPPQRGPVQQPKPREKKPFPVDVVFGLGFISFLLFALWWLYQDDPPEKVSLPRSRTCAQQACM